MPKTAAEDAADGYGDMPSGGKLHGRGATDDKGPALAWLFVIEAFQALKESGVNGGQREHKGSSRGCPKQGGGAVFS